MLEVTGLSAGYLGNDVVHDVAFHVDNGEAVMIIGSNGAGKTTLFQALCGLLSPSSGKVLFEGNDITGLPAERIARLGMRFVSAARHLFPRMTVEEHLLLGAYPHKPPPKTMSIVLDLFPRLAERKGQRAGTMSGGEQQMLAVGRALMSNPRLLVLDGATLTHPRTDATTTYRLTIGTASRGDVFVSCTGGINVSAKGYSNILGSGRTDPAAGNGAFSQSGGSHGGEGGGASPGITYGSPYDPDTPGAAGSGSNCDACAGGGGIVLTPALFSTLPNAAPATLMGSKKDAAIWGTGWAKVQ